MIGNKMSFLDWTLIALAVAVCYRPVKRLVVMINHRRTNDEVDSKKA